MTDIEKEQATETKSDVKKSTHIVILGAGMAGLLAAQELQRKHVIISARTV